MGKMKSARELAHLEKTYEAEIESCSDAKKRKRLEGKLRDVRRMMEQAASEDNLDSDLAV